VVLVARMMPEVIMDKTQYFPQLLLLAAAAAVVNQMRMA
jgi:hypothetical protein